MLNLVVIRSQEILQSMEDIGSVRVPSPAILTFLLNFFILMVTLGGATTAYHIDKV